MKTLTKKRAEKKPKIKVDNSLNDHGNDPFFIKKAEESKKFLEQYGFPEELVQKK